MIDVTATYSLAEAAVIIRGDDSPASLQWLSRRLRHDAQPFLTGYRVGHWRMTGAQIVEALELLRPKQVVLPPVPQASSMTKTSRRRLEATA